MDEEQRNFLKGLGPEEFDILMSTALCSWSDCEYCQPVPYLIGRGVCEAPSRIKVGCYRKAEDAYKVKIEPAKEKCEAEIAEESKPEIELGWRV